MNEGKYYLIKESQKSHRRTTTNMFDHKRSDSHYAIDPSGSSLSAGCCAHAEKREEILGATVEGKEMCKRDL